MGRQGSRFVCSVVAPIMAASLLVSAGALGAPGEVCVNRSGHQVTSEWETGQLGFAYLRGEGGPRDHEKALACFKASARAGDYRAFVNVGYLYGRGEGIPTDLVRAYAYTKLTEKYAPADGRLKVPNNLTAALQRMSSKQVAQAERLVGQLEKEYGLLGHSGIAEASPPPPPPPPSAEEPPPPPPPPAAEYAPPSPAPADPAASAGAVPGFGVEVQGGVAPGAVGGLEVGVQRGAGGSLGEAVLRLPSPESERDQAGSAGERVVDDAYGVEPHGAVNILWRRWKAYFSDGHRVPARRDGAGQSLRYRFADLEKGEEWARLQLEAKDASQLWGSVSPDQAGGKEPVLFVHGYTAGKGLGGGESTWGAFPQEVENLEGGAFAAFEFRWRTDARFEDAASDLAEAVALLKEKTGKGVHLVAHSFGGVLARTYLQGLAERPPEAYPVASVVTLGTPHSGIFPFSGTWEFRSLRNCGNDACPMSFPQGRDSVAVDLASQVSTYQAGEEGGGAEDWNDRLPDLPQQAGELLVKLHSYGENPFRVNDLPVLVLIGLRHGLGGKAGDGDGLISFEGQRFTPGQGRDGARLTGEVVGGARVMETTLAGDAWTPPGTRLEGMGYAHNEAVPKEVATGLLGGAASRAEARVAPGDKDHAALKEVGLWLTKQRQAAQVRGPAKDETFTDQQEGTRIAQTAETMAAPAAPDPTDVSQIISHRATEIGAKLRLVGQKYSFRNIGTDAGDTFLDPMGLQFRHGDISNVFTVFGSYKGKRFDDKYQFVEGGKPRIKFSEEMYPYNKIPEMWMLIQALPGLKSQVLFIVLDEDWKIMINPTNIWAGFGFSEKRAYVFNQLASGVYYDAIQIDATQHVKIGDDKIVIGNITDEKVAREENEDLTFICIW